MFSKGADVDALRDSAGRMASFGREVDVVRARGQRAVSTMQGAWQGPDLQHLVERWRRVEHDLHRISVDFDRLSRRLHDNADLQHRSSGASRSTVSAGSNGSSVEAAPSPQGSVAAGPPATVSASHGAAPGVHGGGPPAQTVVATHALIGWGPDGGRPVGTPGVPWPLQAMAWGHWIGSAGAGASQPVDPGHGPVVSAAVTAAAAHHLGLPIR